MRLYTFNNFYLSSLQQGLQTAHVVGDLNAKYGPFKDINNFYDESWQYSWTEETFGILFDWQSKHKTIIMLNGGNAGMIKDLYNFFDHKDNPYPFTIFYEDEQSLNGAATSVGIVLPERIYMTAENDRFYGEKNWICMAAMTSSPPPIFLRPLDLSDFEEELINRIKHLRLAI